MSTLAIESSHGVPNHQPTDTVSEALKSLKALPAQEVRPYNFFLTTNEKNVVETLYTCREEQENITRAQKVAIITTSGLFGLNLAAARIEKIKKENPKAQICIINIDIGPTGIFGRQVGK